MGDSLQKSVAARTVGESAHLHSHPIIETVGTVRFSPDDQGGNPGGLEIDVGLTARLPRTSYSVMLLGTACQLLFQGGTLTTDDRGRGDLSVHVPSTAVPAGTGLRVRVVALAAADVLTSDPMTGA